jgi:Ca2+-binding EF-hand superfamily protein
MDLRILAIWRKLAFLLGVALFAFLHLADSAAAQGRGGGRRGGGGGGAASEGFFRMLDRNNNGQIDPEEIANSPIRRMFESGGRDLSKPISREEFEELSRNMREQARQGLGGTRGGGDGSSGAGGGRGRAGGRVGRSRESESESEQPSERIDSASPASSSAGGTGTPPSSRSSSTAGSTSKKSEAPNPKKGVRMWLELPEAYRARDKDGDNQIGMYEWPANDYSAFMKLDTNGDGFLTPRELERGPRSAASSGTAGLASSGSDARRGGSAANRGGSSGAESSEDGNSGATAPAAVVNPVSPAETAFNLLDRNKDGTISDEEWQRSISVKGLFERAGATVSLPMSKEDFLKAYPNK